METCNLALVLQNGLLISIKNRTPLITVFEINTPVLHHCITSTIMLSKIRIMIKIMKYAKNPITSLSPMRKDIVPALLSRCLFRSPWTSVLIGRSPGLFRGGPDRPVS